MLSMHHEMQASIRPAQNVAIQRRIQAATNMLYALRFFEPRKVSANFRLVPAAQLAANLFSLDCTFLPLNQRQNDCHGTVISHVTNRPSSK